MSLSKFLDKRSNDSKNQVCVCRFETPLGKVVAAADEKYLYLVSFEDTKKLEKMFQSLSDELSCNFIEIKNEILQNFEIELGDYFGGKLKKFTVPIKTIGSEFQKQVWDKLQNVPYAATQSYGEVAKAMGQSGSYARAVGAACGANGHILIIPCHRVVASGSKGGFSSGIDRKEWLLEHEKKYAI